LYVPLLPDVCVLPDDVEAEDEVDDEQADSVSAMAATAVASPPAVRRVKSAGKLGVLLVRRTRGPKSYYTSLKSR
jgi:hypothetical protein